MVVVWFFICLLCSVVLCSIFLCCFGLVLNIMFLLKIGVMNGYVLVWFRLLLFVWKKNLLVCELDSSMICFLVSWKVLMFLYLLWICCISLIGLVWNFLRWLCLLWLFEIWGSVIVFISLVFFFCLVLVFDGVWVYFLVGFLVEFLCLL